MLLPMNLTQARTVLAALARERVDYVLVGSMAMAVHGLVRATRDMDFFVDPRPENVERLRRALHSVFEDPSIDEISAADLGGDYPAVQYGPPDESVSLDILARLGDAWRYEDLEWQAVDLEGTPVRVATPRTLYRMKRDTVRPQDRLDAAALRRRFSLDEG
jgi:hypothetical protein